MTVIKSKLFGDSFPKRVRLARARGGGFKGEIGDLREDLERTFLRLEVQTQRGPTIYVDASADPTLSNGTAVAPYTTIQEALDHAAALGTPVDFWTDYSVIDVASGVYAESLTYHGEWGVHLKASTDVTVEVRPPSGHALFVTNATPASLADYLVSGDYGDLAYQGNDGCRYFEVSGLYFAEGVSHTTNVEFAGVVDVDTTYFLNNTLVFNNCSVTGDLTTRNVGKIIFRHNFNPWNINISNSHYLIMVGTILEDLILDYDSVSPYGKPIGSVIGYFLYSGHAEEIHLHGDLSEFKASNVHIDESLIMTDTASAEFFGCVVTDIDAAPTYPIDLDDAVTAKFYGGGCRGDVHIEGGVNAELNGFHLQGDLTVLAGAGSIIYNGGWIDGIITSPDGKIIRNGGNQFPEYLLTPIGGLAIRMINNTGGPSVAGTVVEPSQTVDFAVRLTTLDSLDPVGVIYEDGVPDGEEVLVVIYGFADVLLENGTAATREYWVGTSGVTTGRANATTAVPPGAVLAHFQEIGHCFQNVTAGVDKKARILLHFN